MKTILTRIIPLLLCVLVGTIVSWVAFYAFWFGVWMFHTVPAARACDAVGGIVLMPAHYLFTVLSGEQSIIYIEPLPYSGTNGLILGLLLYSGFRMLLKRWEDARDATVANGHRAEVKAPPTVA